MVEEGQDVVAAAGQGAAELGDLFQSGRRPAAYRLDQLVMAFLPRRRFGSASAAMIF